MMGAAGGCRYHYSSSQLEPTKSNGQNFIKHAISRNHSMILMPGGGEGLRTRASSLTRMHN